MHNYLTLTCTITSLSHAPLPHSHMHHYLTLICTITSVSHAQLPHSHMLHYLTLTCTITSLSYAPLPPSHMHNYLTLTCSAFLLSRIFFTRHEPRHVLLNSIHVQAVFCLFLYYIFTTLDHSSSC
jgi:hypothetical protein